MATRTPLRLFVQCFRQVSLAALLALVLLANAVGKDGSPGGNDKSAPVTQTNSAALHSGQPSPQAPASSLADANQMLQRQGPVFIENRGQFDPRVKFLVTGNGANLWLTNDGIVFDFQRPASKQSANADEEKPASLKRLSPGREPIDPRQKSDQTPIERLVFKQKLVSPTPNLTIEARDPQPGIYNYFPTSDPDTWRTHVLAYKEVMYRDVWKGIDLKLFANGPNLEEEFIVHPGADATGVRLAYEGIEGLSVADDGSLKVATAFGDIVETSPRIYQEIAGNTVPLSGSFKVGAHNSYTFEVAKRDEEADLIIDPTVIYSKSQPDKKAAQGSLLYSTFLGGSAGINCCYYVTEFATGIAVDVSGSAYVTGVTASTDFPVTPGAFQTIGPGACSFITKFTPLGNPLQYSTYLCGPGGGASASGIALDSAGDAYVTGSAGPGFPTTSNAFQQSVNGAFMTVLSAGGDSLLYSSGFGGGSPNSIAIDSSGRAYFTGQIGQGSSIPTTPNAFQSSFSDAWAAFLGVLDPSQSGPASLIYGSYLNGSNLDYGEGVAVDAYGMAYVCGLTYSRDFPVTPGAFQVNFGAGTNHAFLTKFNPYTPSGPASVLYSTYLGGGSSDDGFAVAVDSLGDAFIGGQTASADFPTTQGAPLPNWNPSWGNYSGFVTEMNAAGNNLVFSTYWGGENGSVHGIAVDMFGNFYAAGSTSGLLLVSQDAYQSTFGGGQGYGGWFPGDAFVSKFTTQGGLTYSSYLGGINGDSAAGIAADAIGDVYIAGYTVSSNFPVTQGAYQMMINPGGGAGPGDAFVTKFPLGTSGTLSITGIVPVAGGNAGTITGQIIGTGFHDGATAKLACGQTNVPGANLTVTADGRIIQATFDLTATAPGTCDVVVTNPDQTSARLAGAFTVHQGGVPQLWVEVVGNPTITSNGSTYTIAFGNTGTVDAHDAVLTVAIPPNLAYSIGCPVPSPEDLGLVWDLSFVWCQIPVSYLDDSGNQVIPIWVFTLGAGASTQFQITLTPLPPLPQPHQRIQLMDVVIGSAPDSQFSATGDPSLISTSPVAQVIADAILEVFGAEQHRTPATRHSHGLAAPNNCFIDRDHIFNCFQHLVIQYTYVEDNYDKDNGSFPESGAIGGTVGAVVADVPLEAGEGAGETLDLLDQALRLLGRALVPILKNKAEINAYATFLTAGDPNDLGGPLGVGLPMWVSGAQQLGYGIFFYNEPGASAPAQRVVVTNPIDPNSDWSTAVLTTITIPGLQVPIPPTFDPIIGWYDAKMNVDLRPSQDLFVNIDANLNPSTGLLTWTFQSIDPATGLPPTDPQIGFLHPGQGGSVFFGVTARQGLATGTQISDQGTVVFDSLPPMSTALWTNTLDNTPPTSHVTALPGIEQCKNFTVQWSGTDLGSGIANYTIYVSDNGGAFTAWQTNTTSTSAVFNGQVGHNYGFYSVARDLVGNVEPGKTSAETTTRVNKGTICGPIGPPTVQGGH